MGLVARLYLLLAITGCGHLCIDPVVTGMVDAPTVDLCAPLPYDPMRYLTDTSAAGFTVALAIARCQHNGKELVSYDNDDAAELTSQLHVATPPFWTSVSYTAGAWRNADGC